MARRAKGTKSAKKDIESYEHTGKKRANNPPVGLVTSETEPEEEKQTYSYDPHLDPQLIWAGKAERTSFEVPTVSLHVHERIEPRTILEAVRKNGRPEALQGYLFERPDENLSLRDALDFYKHAHGWSNRLIAGDSLLVMNSLLEKEGLGGQVQMIYIDPPYGVSYRSNFQPFINRREVKDGSDEDLTQEPEMVRAFRDTWELGIHSYLTYLRDRLLLSRELLRENGSCFVQISDENVHHVRGLMDEVFGAKNFCSLIAFRKSGGTTSQLLPNPTDYLIWYGKDRDQTKYRQLYSEKRGGAEGAGVYVRLMSPDGKSKRLMTSEERSDPSRVPEGWRIYRLDVLTSQGFRANTTVPLEFEGRTYHPGENANWKTTVEGLQRLVAANRVAVSGSTLAYVRFLEDFPVYPVDSVWDDTGTGSFTEPKVYAVQTGSKAIARSLLMTTDPGDLVFDPTCGSGTTAHVAEQWGRRWITCDTSRVAIAIARQRLMTALYDYYELAHPDQGVGSGFRYKTVPHVTLKSIATTTRRGRRRSTTNPLRTGTRHGSQGLSRWRRSLLPS